MKQKYILLILLAIIISTTSLSVLAVTPNLELTPSTQSVGIGNQATVNILVQDVTDLRGASITLNFDASKLQYVSSADGGFVPGAFLPAPTVDNINGLVTLDLASLSSYASGTGTIMTVVFERITTGDTNVTFGSTTLRDKDNITITHTKGPGCLLTSLIGDFNADGCVEFEDLMIFAMAYGSTPSDANWNPVCDLYPDDKIDFEDLMLFAIHYGECVPQQDTRIIRLEGDLNFGDVQVGNSAQKTLTIYNDGNSTLTVSSINYPTGFSGNWSGPISAGGSQNVTVTFSPTQVTTYSGTLTVNSDKTSGTNTKSVSGNGTNGVSRIIRLEGDLNFGDVQVGNSAQKTLTIYNDGNSTLTVSSINYPTGFSGNWSGPISAGGSQNVTVTFSPTQVTTYSGTLTVNSDKTSGTNTKSVSGNGTNGVSRIIRLEGDLNFGDVQVGNSAQKTLTIYNDGNSTLTVSSINYPTGFSGNWSGPISAGGSQNVTVTFSPTQVTTYSGTLTVNSDKTSGTNTKSVFGNGVSINAKWTVMVYISGDQSGGSSLDSAAWLDLEEMESIGSTDQVKVVVQLDPYDSCAGTYRYYVTGANQGSSYPLYPDDIVGSLSEQDMSDPAVLANFVNWATTNYPADHYLLILWDHGGGWREIDITNKGIMWDYTPSYSYMSMEDLADGLDSFNEHIDIIGFDACLMQMIEVAYQIESWVSDAPDYMVGSEETEWVYGWDYDDILNHLTLSPTMSAATLGETIVGDYCYSSGVTTATLSVINLSNFHSIVDPIFSAFQLALRNSAYQAEIATARTTAQSYNVPDFKDIYDFAERIHMLGVYDCQAEANAVMNFVDNVVVSEGWVGLDVANSHGLSIYLPDTAAEYDSAYSTLLFPFATGWGLFLQHAPPSIVPPTVTTLPADYITSTSARLHGSIDSTGGEEPFDAGFGIRLKSGGLETVVKYPVGNYYLDVTGLTPGTCYEFRFFAENSAGRTYGNYLEFCTGIVPPTVTTLHADNITQTSARVWISIDDTGGEDPFSAGVYWGLKDKLFYSESETESIGSNVTRIIDITENNKIGEISETESPVSADFYFGEEEKISSIIEKIGVGVYSVTLTGLSCNSTYQYRAYAENSAGEGTDAYRDFTTLACSVVPPTVSRGSLYDYSATQVEAWGKIESTGGENPYKAGMYIEDLTTGGSPVGWYILGDFQAGDEYYIIIPNLISGHLYSRCAYAENSAGKGYSDWAIFTKP